MKESNTLIDQVVTFIQAGQIRIYSRALNEIGDIDKEARKFLVGLGFANDCVVNPPTAVFGIAKSYTLIKETKKLKTVDMWTLAVAEDISGILVTYGEDSKVARYREAAKSRTVGAVCFEDLFEESGR